MITVVRHMETDWNAEKRFTAQAFHIRLNQAGIAEAERMADRLIKVPFRAVFCSDQIRAIETAVIIIARCERTMNRVRFVTDPRLREVHVGSLVGMPQSDASQPEFSTRHPNFDYSSIGGETKREVVLRHREIMAEIKARWGNWEVLVVGHGTALRVYLEDIGVTEILTRENYICIPSN
ncbi:MAG: histidine phosphatase family protein [Patescibacteria group bacterium]